MADYKKDFIRFMAECGVLKFGDFVTKSGRNTPYFINTGEYKTGEQLAKLGGFYAQCIKENGIETFETATITLHLYNAKTWLDIADSVPIELIF